MDLNITAILKLLSFLFKTIEKVFRFSPLVLLLLPFENAFSDSSKEWVNEKLNSLTLEQKVQQLFIFGISETTFNEQLKSRLKKVVPGGIIIFKRNIKSMDQIALLNSNLNEFSLKHRDIPSFIMVDQEGGSVSRIKLNPPTPSAQSLGSTADNMLIYQMGSSIGLLLKKLNFNMNLAPVLDFSEITKGSFIGNRSFGNNSIDVMLRGEAFSSGLLNSGIIPTAKHFPGHGDTIQDSHKVLPRLDSDFKTLTNKSLKPFDWFMDNLSTSALMMAHISLPNIDPSGVPATFSKIIIDDLIRKKMNYTGLVITDDLEMSGASSVGNLGERSIKALLAGCDLVMVAWTHKKQIFAYKSVLEAVRTGRISIDLVNEKVRRILLTKYFTLESNKNFTNDLSVSELINRIGIQTKKVNQINFQGSLLKTWRSFPNTIDPNKILIFSADRNFVKSFRSQWPSKVSFIELNRKMTPSTRLNHLTESDSINVFYVSGIGTAKILDGFSDSAKAKSIIVNGSDENSLVNENKFLAFINISSPDHRSGEWLASVLKQKITNTTNRSPSTSSDNLLIKKKRPL